MSRASTLFLVTTEEPERLWRAALWALTAASAGDRVAVLLAAPALRLLARGVEAPAQAAAHGFAGPAALLADAIALGASMSACETEFLLAGLGQGPVAGLEIEPVALAGYWRDHQSFRLVSC